MSHRAQNETPQNNRPDHHDHAHRSATHQRQTIRILFVDDRESDVQRCLEELKQMDFAVSADWVQVPSEFTQRLRAQSYDVIVCDYSMPSWTGMEALKLLRQLNRETPFILVSSILDEEMVGAFLQEGAFDCVDKNRLNRLPMVIALAIEGRALREERKHIEGALRYIEAQYRALVENPTYGISRFGMDGRFLEVNDALVAMLGYGSKEELMAVNLATDIVRDPGARAQFLESYRRTGHVDLIETEWNRKDGTLINVRLSGRKVGMEKGASDGYEIIVEDITEQRASEDNLRRLATTDGLTGLANYRRLSEALELEIKRSERTTRAFAVLLFDLDGMKRINDSYGHLAGNRALSRLANILRSSCRSIDTAARYGGDEFALILPETNATEADVVGRRICELISSDREAPLLSVSVGIAVYPQAGTTIEALLQAADRALYKMKARQRAA
jgi:diguanylate cyclase (GGDEF)-like protein/PAS domain S-box-containing protein